MLTRGAIPMTRNDEGKADQSAGQKECSLCIKPVDVLIRCQIDASMKWKMVCNDCWPSVSGGVADGDASHPHYKYGGLWRNRHVRRDADQTATPTPTETGQGQRRGQK